MFKKFILILIVALSLSSTSHASINESVANRATGEISRSSHSTLPFLNDIQVKLIFASNSRKKLNFNLFLTFEPVEKDKDKEFITSDLFFSRYPFFAYSNAANQASFKVTGFHQARSSKKSFIRSLYTNDVTLSYTPASSIFIYDSATKDDSKNYKQFQGNPYWTDNTTFAHQLIQFVSNGEPFVLTIMHFKTDVDSVEHKNPQRTPILVTSEVLTEWKQILQKNGFM